MNRWIIKLSMCIKLVQREKREGQPSRNEVPENEHRLITDLYGNHHYLRLGLLHYIYAS
uniref:Uncharacterized protein n=1 Tax=Setaria italica TaxID=4555 RepID=K3XP58_SETIT